MKSSTAILIGVGVLGGALAVGALAQSDSADQTQWQSHAGSYTEADVEAGARMLASENPSGSPRLHVEQLFTQLRMRAGGQDLYDRITAGAGWGQQGERGRPVSTDKPATDEFRRFVRAVLDGEHVSQLPRARKWFEPAQSDKAFAIAERARAKLARGTTKAELTAQERRLLKYRRDAEGVRRKWLSEGSKLVAVIDGCEFYT